MANTIILPYTIITSPHTSKRRHWRRYTTTYSYQKQQSSLTHFVHNSTSHLPDIVNDCQNRQENSNHTNEEIKLTCKQIAHSLRLVADQVDQKYCQVSVKDFLLISIDLLTFFFFSRLGCRF